MILMSPVPNFDQSTPVTTTYDAAEHSEPSPARLRRGSRIDWDRADRLYSFCRTRAGERIEAAEARQDQAGASQERHCLRILETLHAQSHGRDDVMAACAVTYFRARAMRDAQHPEFLGEWIGTAP